MAHKRGRGRPRRAVPTQQVAFRLPQALLARIDHYTHILQARTPGGQVTRVDTVRALLEHGLTSVAASDNGAPLSSHHHPPLPTDHRVWEALDAQRTWGDSVFQDLRDLLPEETKPSIEKTRSARTAEIAVGRPRETEAGSTRVTRQSAQRPARSRAVHNRGLNLPTWVIGPPLGDEPLPE